MSISVCGVRCLVDIKEGAVTVLSENAVWNVREKNSFWLLLWRTGWGWRQALSVLACVFLRYFNSLPWPAVYICLLIPLQKARCSHAFFLQSSTDTDILWKMEKLLSVIMFSILENWNKTPNGALCKCL